MLTGKQRSYLRKLAHGIRPVIQVGKEGVSDNFIAQLERTIEDRELIKISVLENSGLETKETANEIIKKTNAEFVQAIGRKIVIYRESRENPEIKIPKVKTKSNM